MEQNRKARVIAYYLPQFHPIPENDKWWGKGFTEWTNVGKAKPLFKGHYQPRVPADLGYYDLRMPEIRQAQADMAKAAGVEGFCYWHYWFGNGRQLLERPFKEVLSSGQPDFPFCLGWANESWTNKSWEAGTRQIKLSVLMKQEYSMVDYEKHFNYVLPAFRDRRYITVDGKPLFVIYKPFDIPDPIEFINLWQSLARKSGLKGIHFVAVQHNVDSNAKDKTQNCSKELFDKVRSVGFDAINSQGYIRAEYMSRSKFEMVRRLMHHKLTGKWLVSRCRQADINKYLYVDADRDEDVYPILFPRWDRTPRSGAKARIYTGSTPEVFDQQIKHALSLLENKSSEHKILFLRSWNEWAEGNYVEPDLKYGHGFLEVMRKNIIW